MKADYGLLQQNLPQFQPQSMTNAALGGMKATQDMAIQQRTSNQNQQQVDSQTQFQQAHVDKIRQEMSLDKLKMLPSLFGNISDSPSYQQALLTAKQYGFDTEDMPTTWSPEAQAFTQRMTSLAKTALQQTATADMKEASAMGMTLQQYYDFKSQQKAEDYKGQKSVYTDAKVDEDVLKRLAASSNTARDLVYKIDILEELDKAVETGKFAEAKLLAQQIGGALGNKDLAFDAGNAEALKALSRQAQLTIQTMLKGQTSNRDMTQVIEGSPELMKSEGGNAQVRAAMKAQGKRSDFEYQFSRAYKDKFGTTSGYENAYDKMLIDNPILIRDENGLLKYNPESVKLNDKFGKYLVKPDYSSPENKSSPTTTANSNTPQQTQTLPSGFTAPNGAEITPEHIKARAAKEGISEEQVISKYGLKKKSPELSEGNNSAMKLNNQDVPDHVATAINKGAKIAGVDPGFMFAMAKQESNFDPEAKASTSSATGLYQFINSTWQGMVDKYGKQYGIDYGDIKDPTANAIMGALFAKDNKNYLENELGIQADPTDLYFAHFLGAGGAKKFLKGAMQDNSQLAINLVSPAQAKANRSIFYHKDGTPRTAKEVYQLFDKKVGEPARQFSIALNQPKEVAV